ncbi:MAG: hypothetical protein DA405_08440 [Bacteroidetes bacterium]|nr:MAG: hypothetical protein DA405_08440 [Bacteroidota bacterium]
MALSRTTKNLRFLVILIIALEIAGIVFHFYQITSLRVIIEGEFVSSAYINQISDWSYWQFLLHLALYSSAGLLFLRWSYVSQAGKQFVKSNASKTLNEVMLLWFVPVLNLFRPAQHIIGFSIKQYLKISDEAIKSYQALIIVWWCMWLVSGPFGRFLAYLSLPHQSVEQAYTYLIVYVFLEFLSIITGILFLVILGRQLRFLRENK